MDTEAQLLPGWVIQPCAAIKATIIFKTWFKFVFCFVNLRDREKECTHLLACSSNATAVARQGQKPGAERSILPHEWQGPNQLEPPVLLPRVCKQE